MKEEQSSATNKRRPAAAGAGRNLALLLALAGLAALVRLGGASSQAARQQLAGGAQAPRETEGSDGWARRETFEPSEERGQPMYGRPYGPASGKFCPSCRPSWFA